MPKIFTHRKNLIPNLVAGLTTAIADIPDAMASAVLAGTNPVYGLYAIMVGKPIGGLLTSSHFMPLAVTSAMALTAGSALIGFSGEQHGQALFTLTLLVGLVQIVAGLLKMGRLMRFVSNAVMVGFVNALGTVAMQAAYLPDGDVELMNRTPQSSQRARAVDAWAAMRTLGREGVADLVDRCSDHAIRFADGLRTDSRRRLKILNRIESVLWSFELRLINFVIDLCFVSIAGIVECRPALHSKR